MGLIDEVEFHTWGVPKADNLPHFELTGQNLAVLLAALKNKSLIIQELSTLIIRPHTTACLSLKITTCAQFIRKEGDSRREKET